MSWNLENDPKNTGRVSKSRWSTTETNSSKRYCAVFSTVPATKLSPPVLQFERFLRFFRKKKRRNWSGRRKRRREKRKKLTHA